MNDKNGITITVRDRLLIAWENSTELVRDYQAYAEESKRTNKDISALFNKYAEQEAVHAAKFLELLQRAEDSVEL